MRFIQMRKTLPGAFMTCSFAAASRQRGAADIRRRNKHALSAQPDKNFSAIVIS
jgi:hypothetical protein